MTKKPDKKNFQLSRSLDWVLIFLSVTAIFLLFLSPSWYLPIILLVLAGLAILRFFTARETDRQQASQIQTADLLGRFPETNPNPVLYLSSEGQIAYANAGCKHFLKRFDLPSDPAKLLPPDLANRIRQLRQSGQACETWEYTIDNHFVACQANVQNDGLFLYITDISARKRMENELSWHAYHDVITGLPNRYRFQQDLEKILRRDQPCHYTAVFLMNIDRFRFFIGNLGYWLCDQLLHAVSVRLRETIETNPLSDQIILYRFEADTFALLLKNYQEPELPKKIAQQLIESLHQPVYMDHREFCVTISCGISVYPTDGTDFSTLLHAADLALQHAKKRGGGVWQLHTADMDERTRHRLKLEGYLRHAIEHNELELFYQPQVSLKDGILTGAEITLRWRHPEHCLLKPQEFIPLAEETGLIAPISEWILRHALIQHRAWQTRDFPPIRLAVNISAQQFHQQDLPQLIRRLLQETQVAPHFLELELTESAAMFDINHTVVVMQQLKELGVQLALDDFGTGFSSLAYLRRFPLDTLKIDQSFVRPMDKEEDAAAIIKGIISLGHSLRLKVLAEGIETQAQLQRLRDFECDEGQGYLFSKPVPGNVFETYLARGKFEIG